MWCRRLGLYDAQPWLPFDVIEWLDQTLEPTWRVFEYGSGGSTLFLARRVSELISIEHDPTWFSMVEKMLHQASSSPVGSVRYRLIEPRLLNVGEAGRCPSTKSCYQRYDFAAYVQAIDQFQDESFDAVIVDGRARTSCVGHAKCKVRPGGWLILDNSNRAEYAPAHELLREWENQRFSGCTPGQTDGSATTMWQAPAYD